MNKESCSMDQMLPFGEMLRVFMEQSFVGKSELKELLRKRGVFTHGSEKNDTIPILAATILSPSEFNYLRECQSSKEDNPKIITQSIGWESEETLLDSMPEKLEVNSILDLDFVNYKVVGSPSFIPIDNDPNHIKMSYSVERIDLSKSWATTNNIFLGSLELKRVKEGNEIKMVITHTSNETKSVATKVSSCLVKHLKEEGHINSSNNIEKILFSSFSNPKRIEYLLSITKSCRSTILEFIDIVDVEFSPDTQNPLPEGIDWMQEKIDDLKLNGNALHQTFFLKDKKFHEFLHLYNVDSKFKFSGKFEDKELSGTCVMSIGFPDYGGRVKNSNAEMEVNIRTISIDLNLQNISRSEIKQIILKEVENQKIENFKSHRLNQV